MNAAGWSLLAASTESPGASPSSSPSVTSQVVELAQSQYVPMIIAAGLALLAVTLSSVALLRTRS